LEPGIQGLEISLSRIGLDHRLLGLEVSRRKVGLVPGIQGLEISWCRIVLDPGLLGLEVSRRKDWLVPGIQGLEKGLEIPRHNPVFWLNILYLEPSILFPVSCIQYPVSSILYPVFFQSCILLIN